jgi:hypothetical protein
MMILPRGWSASVMTRTCWKARRGPTLYWTEFSVMVPVVATVLSTVSAGRSAGGFSAGFMAGKGVCWIGRSGFGRGGSAWGVACQAADGVTRPGSPWWGRSVLVDVVERVDLGL